MAFATSNVQTTVFGNLRITYGDWTGAVGDAAGTIGVGGGRVYFAQFTAENPGSGNDGPYLIEVPISVSTSGNVSTVSVYNTGTVNTGRFVIIGK